MTYPTMTIHHSFSQIGPETAEELAGTPRDRLALFIYIEREIYEVSKRSAVLS